VARTGGDEFAVILEEPGSREGAVHVAAELTKALAPPLLIEGQHIQIGASIGIAIFPEDATSCEAMFVAADSDMYAQKRGSRKRSLRNSGFAVAASEAPAHDWSKTPA
jgi:diguanylate cyclase (GGDEF)-like protein